MLQVKLLKNQLMRNVWLSTMKMQNWSMIHNDVTPTEEEKKVTISDQNGEKDNELAALELTKKWSTPQLETSEAQGGTHLPKNGKHLPPISEQNQEEIVNDQETSFSNISSDQPLVKGGMEGENDKAHPQLPLFSIPDQGLESPLPSPYPEEAINSFSFNRQETLVPDPPQRKSSFNIPDSSTLVMTHNLSSNEFFGPKTESNTTLTSLKDTENQLQDESTLQRKESTATLKSNYGGGQVLVPTNQVSKQLTESICLHTDEEYSEGVSVLESCRASLTENRSSIVQTGSLVNPRHGDTTTSADTSADASETDKLIRGKQR